MALGPIGNTIFTNQMTASVASVQNAHTNRVDLQNVMAQEIVNEKDEKLLEVRPTEENQEIDEDREHTKDETKRENQRSEKKEERDEKREQNFTLDIMV
jgi:hypothetical protein